MLRIVFLLVLALGGCAGVNDTPLPVVHASDPTWQLQPDHLDYGVLPQ